jgi:hypothetical protein
MTECKECGGYVPDPIRPDSIYMNRISFYGEKGTRKVRLEADFTLKEGQSADDMQGITFCIAGEEFWIKLPEMKPLVPPPVIAESGPPAFADFP